MKQRLINLFKDKGFLITFGVSFTLLSIFFSGPLFHANTTYFGTTGDGMQNYYASLYHVKYDDSYFFQKCMNYPYGENVFFTGCQPLLTAPLKLFGLYSITLGVINLTMLLSIVLSAIFIYLIFRELEVPYLYAALCATAIAYLSPQMIRLFAHYTLTYQFAIPAFIYFLMRFYKTPSMKKSIVIACLTFYMATTHLYFFGFFALLAGFYWAVLFCLRKENFRNLWFCIKHFSLQIVIPFVLFQLIIATVNDVHDRTNAPWGILEYKTNWTGVFYPFQKYYEFIPQKLGIDPQTINSSEGRQFAGLLATLFFIIVILKFVFNILRFKITKAFSLTGNLLIDIFLWCSVAALLYSFGYPFIFNHEDWLNHVGILRQMRGIARFAWLFYYVMNIAAVYLLYLFVRNLRFKWIKYACMSLALLILSIDAFSSIGSYNGLLSNKVLELNDRKNKAWQNVIFKTFEPEKYQAILALPFFHIGSENIGLEPEHKTFLYAFIFSLKTGLPMLNNASSRTSMSQTANELAVVLEKTTEPLLILKDLKNRKPLLLLVNPDKVRIEEKKLVDLATPVGYYTNGFQLYSLSLEALETFGKKLYHEVDEQSKNAFPLANSNYMASDSVVRFVANSFDDHASKKSFKGTGAYYSTFRMYSDLYWDSLPNFKGTGKYTVSFWMYNIKKDETPRLTLALEVKGKEGNFVDNYWTTANQKLQSISGNWALIETDVTVNEPTDKLKLTLFNFNSTKDDTLIVDELMIRPAGYDVYKRTEEFVFKNNRYYYKN